MLEKAVEGETEELMTEVIGQYEDANAALAEDGEGETRHEEAWRAQVVCLNDTVADHNPLIGREAELERTIQVLCRKEKNNPLHVGEAGVGKTALVYGLAARIVAGDVPERLSGSRIYQLDLGTLLAGTQFRGDFEKRIKSIMDGVRREGKAIVYIDEIHNLVGAGRTGDGSMDASNMLKPYLEAGDIRFIGSTTYEEFNRYLSRSKGIVRRFQQIDIDEPSVDETVKIIGGLKQKYEEFHHVEYPDEVIEYAVAASAKYINDRFLPDKAIDLIDEAGAYRELHPAEDGSHVVDKTLISEILAKVCKVDAMAMKDDDNAALETLYERVGASIYGQDEAVRQVVEAVQMSKAGLLDDDKPLASLLFVGPTGVGKTEVARVLAREMGIALVRFDMSEYTEKHTVAKLIGSPAGYVGYEDGGLLTDAIRKTPNCVLLLDEIEKAHADIYNILLQVMDYARLTDNKGRKADFRNVVLIMTSNAGAQYASQASVGFGARVSAGEAMLRQVKRTFKPEFINRLSATVVFNDMDRTMAGMILDKKLRELQTRLDTRHVVMRLSDAAREWLLEKGFTQEYGAREIDRVIAHDLKPLLMREILFGRLKDGGEVTVDVADSKLKISL
jgi:ATP-dependent Clp protease ATP-binding subunit ClpA